MVHIIVAQQIDIFLHPNLHRIRQSKLYGRSRHLRLRRVRCRGYRTIWNELCGRRLPVFQLMITRLAADQSSGQKQCSNHKEYKFPHNDTPQFIFVRNYQRAKPTYSITLLAPTIFFVATFFTVFPPFDTKKPYETHTAVHSVRLWFPSRRMIRRGSFHCKLCNIYIYLSVCQGFLLIGADCKSAPTIS